MFLENPLPRQARGELRSCAMPALTTLLLAAFAIYLAGWSAGAIQGDLGQVLLVATLVTGSYWLADRMVFLPKRRREAAASATAGGAGEWGKAPDAAHPQGARPGVPARPWWLNWAGLFPSIAGVCLLHNLLFEPFRIPSGSMAPTLLPGDLVLVEKFAYGLRLPATRLRLPLGGTPQRGDVVVFHYPQLPQAYLVKRIVGLPGDEVAYLDRRLSINGQRVPLRAAGSFVGSTSARHFQRFDEELGAHRYQVLHDDVQAAGAAAQQASDGAVFPAHEHCRHPAQGVVCTVPPGQYFVLGDSRDHSWDSRFWGFVPEDAIVGRATVVWLNLRRPDHIGAIP